MTKKLDIIKMTKWANDGFSLKDFYDIFNIPYPTYEEIPKAIQELSELFDNYSYYVTSISNDNKRNKIEEHLKFLFADIFGELALSIKLAGEGFISYSLREIRSVFDLLFAGLFTVSSWPPGSAKNENGVNPLANAFFSGYWGQLKELNLDDLILPELKIRENANKQAMSILHELSEKFYPDIISEFDLTNDVLKMGGEKRVKDELSSALKTFFIKVLKNHESWPNIAKGTLGDKEYFYYILMNNNGVTLRSCKEHEEKMLTALMQKLGLGKELTDEIKENLRELTFIDESGDEESNLCDYCENKAEVYGIYSRPDTRAMVKLIKLQLEQEELNGINSCIKEGFKIIGRSPKKTYFGDIIYSELYYKLNNYVHSNIVEEPSVGEWFYNFFAPTIIILQCILSRPLWFSNQTKP